ncbi:TPM domain-containing protein [Candidatus Saccharibacteria bacterium]|nr:MAG: TPM domain-containing protein [Candidatus Saccharibacteria bacterium]
MIDDAVEAQLSQKLIDYKAKTGNEIAVLTIKSLQGEDNFGYSFRVAQSWGVGSKEANNGVLFFVAVEDHKDYIQVGRGLEPYLTDLQSNLILKQKVNPCSSRVTIQVVSRRVLTASYPSSAAKDSANPKAQSEQWSYRIPHLCWLLCGGLPGIISSAK